MALLFWRVFLFFLLCHSSSFLSNSLPKLPDNSMSFHATFNKKNGSSNDELALLSFKSLITSDPYGGLASWGNHSLHFCKWYGVTCSKYRDHLKITALDLQALDLSGPISPSLCYLSFLQKLHLAKNLLYGIIPNELGLLSNLLHLNLRFNLLEGMIPPTLSQCYLLQSISLKNNSFHGEIPSNLSHCSDLRIIDFQNNFFVGIIPTSLGFLNNLEQLLLFNNILEANEESDWAFLAALSNCSNLQALDLSRNRLGGSFPSSIGNLSLTLQILYMETNQITGNIPTSISRLTNLKKLYLGENILEGTLPQEIGFLHKLELFSLHYNQISGVVPNSLGNLSSLRFFSLYGNQFGGHIPRVLKNLTTLTLLSLSENNFVGHVPSFLGSLLSITKLYLSSNHLVGNIPRSLGNLHSLNTLELGSNNLEGAVPYSIWNLSSLQYIDLQQNNLYDVIPTNIGQTLPNLIYLLLYQNQFHGPIPTSLSNCTSLELIGLSKNAFTGKVPINLGVLKSLSGLTLENNRLEARVSADWAFLESLTNCTNLEELVLANNEFSGILPSFIANLSINLRILSLSGNRIGGTIPTKIKNLVGLNWLDLGGLQLTGNIPSTIGSLPSLRTLELESNELYGEIPYTIGNLTRLSGLYLHYNNLSGHIPSTLRRCIHLEVLDLASNKLSGEVPREVTALFSLTVGLSLSNNFLIGSLPTNVGSLIHLDDFDVSYNKLSGKIPDNFGHCTQLRYLYMENNFFEGTIPLSLQALRGLEEMDLSHNKLVGEIPKYLETFPLKYLNLSFNHFEGEVPKSGIFANASAFSVLGNKQLCGGIPELNLPDCFNPLTKKSKSKLIVVITVASVAIFFIILISIFIAWRNKICKVPPFIWRLKNEQHIKVSYTDLLKATNGFAPQNLIGSGSFGSVYKGNMNNNDNNIVAVKVLNLQQRGSLKSFEAECKAMRSARHRNLVKVLTACSSIDYAGNDFKALVFEFMPNGSLDKWLHPQLNDGSINITYLSLTQRLSIVVDVACALDYLHNQGSMQIIHCDLKPSNVLLDEDMIAHVGDFGLAKLLIEDASKSSPKSTGSAALKGTIGYVAPEYGMANDVSTRGDVYSFGILLLEIFTGRSPTDRIFIESHSLHKFVQMAFPEQVISIIDPNMFSQEEVGNQIDQRMDNMNKHELECIVSVLNIGLLCSKESPLERIQIGQAFKELHEIKDIFNKVEQARQH
ncbi:hypothetical protein KFK09_027723 [Dendrobium nobile]|uniref:Receptor kinase-like protein Xa21 n=1 Tax=Dendrobium nobile TaxID=94219 RepID=A0A8T3A1H4_DENNO|nr:hypothetical protein KFK09_027723 [Dendrobium nobile]